MLDGEPASLAQQSAARGEIPDRVREEAVTDDQDGAAPKLGRVDRACHP